MHMMHVMILSMQMMQMHVLSICMYARPTPEQTIDAAPGKTLNETAVDAAALAKAEGITLFAWGTSRQPRATSCNLVQPAPV